MRASFETASSTLRRSRATAEGAEPLRREWLAEAGVATLAAAATSALLVPVLELWRANLRVPFAYSSDAIFNAMLIKGTIDHGWWYANHDLGAPFGQELHDFAIGSVDLDLVIVRLLGLVWNNPALVLNLLFLLSFPLSALAAYAVLRWARISRAVACACSVLYALTPYHLIRGESHLFLAVDFAVPVGAYLVLATWSGSPTFSRRAGRSGLLGYLSWRSALTLLACAIVASTGDGFYYAAFTIILVGAGALVRGGVGREPSTFLQGAAIAACIAAFAAANLAPTLAYAAAHGRNLAVANRQPLESDRTALKLTELVLPVDHHHLRPLARLKAEYAWSVTPTWPNEVYSSSLGTIGSLGFVWLLAVLAASCAGFRGRAPTVVVRSRPAAAASATAFLVGTTGGLSALFAYLISPQLRGWNRISIFIAFFSLLAVGILLERLRAGLSSTVRRRLVFGVLLVVLTGIGVLDQTTGSDVPSYGRLARSYARDADFAHRIETVLPAGAMVFELPYMSFPEAPRQNRMIDYDPARPYLHSSRLRWSFGAMRGRPQDWAMYLTEKPLSLVVPAVAAAGFAGIYVDRFGYGSSARGVQRILARLCRTTPLVSRGGRFVFFDLRPYAARLRAARSAQELERLRRATLMPPLAEPADGVSRAESFGRDGHRSWWITSSRASLDLHESGAAEEVVFHATLKNSTWRIPAPKASLVALRWPDGTTTRLEVTWRGVAFDHRFRLRHGRNLLRLSTDGPPMVAPWDPRTLYLELVDARFSEAAFAPFSSA